MLRVFTAILLSFMVLSSPAAAWWNKDWKYRKAVTVDTTATGVNVSGTIGRTVVLLRLHNGNFTFTEALDNGADIRVVDTDDKTPLPYHVESYDGKTGIATVWVSVPTLNGGEKKQLWLYFGNSTAPDGGDSAGTFDAEYSAVYHFGEGPGAPAKDSTANANNSINPPPGVTDAGIIGRSATFPGQGAVTIAPSPSLAIAAGTGFTFSSWVKPSQIAGSQAVYSRGGLVIGLNGGVPFASFGGGTVQGNAPVAEKQWSHIALVADGTTVTLFLNGIEAGSASAALPAIDGEALIGGSAEMPFAGEIDELRLSKVARPAAMILAMASAEGPESKLVTVSESAEQQGSGGGVFFFILSKVHTLDQFIIGLCMLLLAGAIAVMVMKLRYLNTAERGNSVFMKRFAAMHENLIHLSTIPGIDTKEVAYMEASPIGKLYETGLDELDVRRARGKHALSTEAVEAMRAAVDAVVVEENQKLDRAMVLLTIAISGGPFIGLLGTVIGVMSTFGGVAMAGEVNVNAIAPGIAAALLATIAGLAAAIPALFGYNYLNSRISTLSDSMRVFVDRLITRLAEVAADEAEEAAK